jgi:hypothetical protein
MWDKILEINWKRRYEERARRQSVHETISGTNGATLARMRGINSMIRTLLDTVVAPLFACAVLALIVLGELNFFSPPVRWQTEPIQSIGGWVSASNNLATSMHNAY